MKYEADIGCWEKGFVETIHAESDSAALTIAYKRVDEAESEGRLPQNSIVVQVRRGAACVYDYMNGFYSRKR